MAGKAKALTRKISRKRALSYDRMAPNRRGVTALSEVNGKGSYARRYDATRRFLEGNDGMKRSGKRRSSAKSMRPNLRRGGATVKKSDFLAEQAKKGASKKQAEARWKFARRGQGYKTTRKVKPKSYAGARALKARIGRGPGKKTVQSYAFRDKRTGRVRKIPDYKLLGYKSAAAMRQVYRTGSEKERARLGARMQRLLERREKASKTAAKRALEGRSLFSPNAGDGVLSFEEWSKMKKNAKKKTSTAKRRKSTAKKSTAAKRRKTTTKSRSRSAAAKKAAATRKKNAAKRSAPAKKAARTRKRRAGTRKTSAKRAASKRRTTKTKRRTTKKRSTAKRRVSTKARRTTKKRRTLKQRRASIRNLKRGCRKVRTMKANRRGSYAKRSAAAKKAARTRKRRLGATRRRSSYRRNASGAMFKMELKNAFKFGFFVTGGLLAHRIASNLLAKYALSKIEAVETSGYKGLISSVITAAIGIPVAVRALPKHAGVFAAGMGASVIVEIAKLVASKLEQPAILEAISAYPDAPGYAQYSGLGAYYQYTPHQVFSGMGSYYETSPVPGLEQAAAGYGQLPPLQQMYANPLGEYIAMGMEGIGEYESAPSAPDFSAIDNGIAPNLNSAENALSVAEAAAGLGGFGSTAPMLTQAAAGYGGYGGFGDLPLQSTVNPMIQAMDIPDEPGGSRAGILAGGDGIFG